MKAIVNRLEYYVVRGVVFFVGLLPFPLLHLLANGLSFLLHTLFRYRRKTVQANLLQAFPDLPASHRRAIARQFYQHLAIILLESIKGLSLSEAQLRQRYPYENTDIFQDMLQNNQSAIILGGHFCNWEWGVLSFSLWVNAPVVGSYKPIKNPLIEQFLRKKRQRFGLRLSPMSQTGRAVVQHRNKSAFFVLIADQTPSNLQAAHWLPFFGLETPFLNGPDKLARQTGYPVYYFDIQRKGKSRYSVQFKQLCEDARQLPEGVVTALFKEELEKSIRQYPADWLWSHRRWKRAKRGKGDKQ